MKRKLTTFKLFILMFFLGNKLNDFMAIMGLSDLNISSFEKMWECAKEFSYYSQSELHKIFWKLYIHG